jgi:hypothetical protein
VFRPSVSNKERVSVELKSSARMTLLPLMVLRMFLRAMIVALVLSNVLGK